MEYEKRWKVNLIVHVALMIIGAMILNILVNSGETGVEYIVAMAAMGWFTIGQIVAFTVCLLNENNPIRWSNLVTFIASGDAAILLIVAVALAINVPLWLSICVYGVNGMSIALAVYGSVDTILVLKGFKHIEE